MSRLTVELLYITCSLRSYSF